MKVSPYRTILKRCEKIKAKSLNALFLEAGVDPANIYNWKKKESQGVIRWVEMIKSLPEEAQKMVSPNTSTWSIAIKLGGSEQAATDYFEDFGFKKGLIKSWKYEDPYYIESYKKVLSVVQKHEGSEAFL